MAYKDLAKQREYQRRWMAARRAEFIDGKRCTFCNGTDRLELHHFDPALKVHHAIWSWTKERREAEIAKCIVLCRACHIRRHREQRPTHCKRGHELTKANSYVKPSSKRRECRTCRALRRIASRSLEGVDERSSPTSSSDAPGAVSRRAPAPSNSSAGVAFVRESRRP